MAAEIRRAGAGDIDRLDALERAAFAADRISRKSYRRLISSPSAIVLVADGGLGAEGAAVVLTRRGSATARLYSVAVARPGQGLGHVLLRAAETAARERGATRLSLEVREDNEGARRLYERTGFAVVKTCPDYYADGAAALRMQKPLAPPGTGEDGGTPSS